MCSWKDLGRIQCDNKRGPSHDPGVCLALGEREFPLLLGSEEAETRDGAMTFSESSKSYQGRSGCTKPASFAPIFVLFWMAVRVSDFPSDRRCYFRPSLTSAETTESSFSEWSPRGPPQGLFAPFSHLLHPCPGPPPPWPLSDHFPSTWNSEYCKQQLHCSSGPGL